MAALEGSLAESYGFTLINAHSVDPSVSIFFYLVVAQTIAERHLQVKPGTAIFDDGEHPNALAFPVALPRSQWDFLINTKL
jgi:hypothetical protein